VSAYIEAFVLIGIAAGGSAVVLGAALPFASNPSGSSSVAVQNESIRQGTYLAIEMMTVMNLGQTSISSFVVSTSQAPNSAPYCYAVYDVATGEQSTGACPTKAANPSSVTIVSPVQPGGAEGVVITIVGSVFEIGSTCAITVTTSDGAQQSVGALVVPA